MTHSMSAVEARDSKDLGKMSANDVFSEISLESEIIRFAIMRKDAIKDFVKTIEK